MGTWNTGLFSNDTTCDVKETYMSFLKQQLSDEDAYRNTCAEYEELIGSDEEDLFWFALADVQWNVGRLLPEVKEATLAFLHKPIDADRWDGAPKLIARWKNTLQKLEDKITSPMPPRKLIPKPIEYTRNPWEVGDVYAYQFHTEKAIECGFEGKYILFQKIGNAYYCDGEMHSLIQVFEGVFDYIPGVDVIKGLRILPLINPPGKKWLPNDIADYIPSFEHYLNAIFVNESPRAYPKKYLTYVGAISIPNVENKARRYHELSWHKDRMEDWLIEWYLDWQGVEY